MEEETKVRDDSLFLSKLTTKVRCVIARPFVASLSEVAERLTDYGYEFAMIEHDKDTKPNGELKQPHVHLVMVAKKRHRLSYYISFLQNVFKKTTTNAIEVQPSESIEFDIQYLTHQNDALKYPYERKKIISNLSPQSLESILNMEIKKVLTADDILEVVKNCKTRTDVIVKLGRGTYTNAKSLVDAFINDAHLGENLKIKEL